MQEEGFEVESCEVFVYSCCCMVIGRVVVGVHEKKGSRFCLVKFLSKAVVV